MIYSDNNLLYCKNIIRHISAPILKDLLDWGEGVAGISKLSATLTPVPTFSATFHSPKMMKFAHENSLHKNQSRTENYNRTIA